MAKYADIEPFYEWLVELMRLDTSRSPEYNTLMFYEILDELDSLPELVHCKDCKWWKRTANDCGYCYAWDGGRRENNFCNYGERKDG